MVGSATIPKPKWMRWPTFDRKLGEIAAAEEFVDAGVRPRTRPPFETLTSLPAGNLVWQGGCWAIDDIHSVIEPNPWSLRTILAQYLAR